MLAGCLIVGFTIDKELHWIAYLIGGGLFFFCLSAATGLLQTVSCSFPFLSSGRRAAKEHTQRTESPPSTTFADVFTVRP